MQILFLFDCFVFCLFGATLHTMATYVRFTGIQIMPVTLCYPLLQIFITISLSMKQAKGNKLPKGTIVMCNWAVDV